jgi:TPR repeat protein
VAEEVLGFLQRVCDGGEAMGCDGLAGMYAQGRGVAQDKAKAAELYQKACDGGNTVACHHEDQK